MVFHIATPPQLASGNQSLPPILNRMTRISIPSCSKASRGLFVLPRVSRIFTTCEISPSPRLREFPDRYPIRAGQNLPDKEFRYLRTVIVTAGVHPGLDSRLILQFALKGSPILLTFGHWPGVSPYTSPCGLAGTCVFVKQSPGIFCCGPT